MRRHGVHHGWFGIGSREETFIEAFSLPLASISEIDPNITSTRSAESRIEAINMICGCEEKTTFRGCDATIWAPLAASETVAENSSTAPAPSDSSGAAEFGFTVMIGVPLVTFALTAAFLTPPVFFLAGPAFGFSCPS